MKYKHILVALELTDESKMLIDKAVSMAELMEAKVSFVHIDGTHGEIYPELMDLKKEPNQLPLNDHFKAVLKNFGEYTDYPIEQILVGTGDLGDKLESTINEKGFDLLVCGHHHDFWSRIVSYSKHLINKSPIDILVVPIES